jgi:hypothetical protein
MNVGTTEQTNRVPDAKPDAERRHEIALMKIYMERYPDEAIKFMLESNQNGR